MTPPASVAAIEALWSRLAPSFDEEADHGLTNPQVRDAWRRRLHTWVPATARRVLDIGCGTGSLSVLLAERSHQVTAIDLSRAMLREAASKVQSDGEPDGGGATVDLAIADASSPPFRARSFDAIVCRHLVWTLPNPHDALANWASLLVPSGRLVAIEGRWTGRVEPDPELPWDGGVSAATISNALAPHFGTVELVDLARDSMLWGKDVTDERHAVIATEPGSGSGSRY